MIDGSVVFQENIICASYAEAVAISLGVNWAKGINIFNFMIESDCVDIIN